LIERVEILTEGVVVQDDLSDASIPIGTQAKV
jgi:hypothetical protein